MTVRAAGLETMRALCVLALFLAGIGNAQAAAPAGSQFGISAAYCGADAPGNGGLSHDPCPACRAPQSCPPAADALAEASGAFLTVGFAKAASPVPRVFAHAPSARGPPFL